MNFKCSSCAWWNPVMPTTPQGIALVNKTPPAGTCRRYPPAPILAGDQMLTVFPTTSPENACGEFKAKTSA